MIDQIKRESKTLAIYLAIAWLSGLAVFAKIVVFGRADVSINLQEAWRFYSPVLYRWLMFFALFAFARLFIVWLIERFRRSLK